MRRIYLNELEAADELGVGLLKLVIESKQKSPEFARQLINKAREEFTDAVVQQKFVEFIETIVVYKFPNLSREEIEAMLNLSLIKQTRVYQEAKEEGKLEIVPKLLQRGFSIQEIAELLELEAEIIRQAAKQQS